MKHMKRPSIITALSGLLLAAGLFTACEKDARDEVYGNINIFMPQATLGGNRYAVPQGLDSATFNYRIDQAGDKVNVILGVARSGQQGADAFSVNILANADTITKMINTGALDASNVVMPANLYSLPQSIAVDAGKTANTFYLSLNKTQLKTYAGKKVALGISINQPSNYSISPGADRVIVIVDVNALKL